MRLPRATPEMVRLVIDHGSSWEALLVALIKGHLDVAEYLRADRTDGAEFDRAFLYASMSGSRAVLEWTVANFEPTSTSPTMIRDAFLHACTSGDLGCVEYLCGLFGRDTIAESVFGAPTFFVFSKSVPVLRFLRATFGYEMDLQKALALEKDPFPDDVFDYFLATPLGFDNMRALSKREVYAHAFMVRKGLIPVNLAKAAANVRTAAELKTLMDLCPDPRRWMEEIEAFAFLLDVGCMQALFGAFFRGHRHRFRDSLLAPIRRAAGHGLQMHERHAVESRARIR